MNYLEITKKCILVIFFIVLIIFALKISIFYIPFLIAYIISILTDPLIKWLNKKTSFSRKVCSVIVLMAIFSTIILIIICGSIRLVSETTNLINGLNNYLDKAINILKEISLKFKIENLNFSDDVTKIFQNAISNYLKTITTYLTNLLNKILNYITAIPNMFINIVITILATYFITSDKFYILDRLEHHLSKRMMGKIIKHSHNIINSLGGYLKAEITLSGISFLIILTGLNIFCLLGMNVEYPILMALLIGFIDLLPILGAGSIMIPWSILLFFNNNYSLGISILGLLILVTIVKQVLEPKLVSKNISVHPIFTLISMYTGFKLIGIIGLIIRTYYSNHN